VGREERRGRRGEWRKREAEENVISFSPLSSLLLSKRLILEPSTNVTPDSSPGSSVSS